MNIITFSHWWPRRNPKLQILRYRYWKHCTFCLNFLNWNIESSGANTNLHFQSIRISLVIVNNHRSPIRNQLSLRLCVWIVQTWHLNTIFAEAARKQRTATRSRIPCNKLIHWLMKINRMNRNRFSEMSCGERASCQNEMSKRLQYISLTKTEKLSVVFRFVEYETRLLKENWEQRASLKRGHSAKNRERKATKSRSKNRRNNFNGTKNKNVKNGWTQGTK